MEERQRDRPAWQERVAELARLREAVQSGQTDPLQLDLAAAVQATVEAFGAPPQAPQEQERWLGAAGEALRLASELLALKASRLAPEPAPEASAPGRDEQAASDAALLEDPAAIEPGAEAEGGLDALARRAEAYRRFREAARLLEEQAEAWSRHQPRQAPSVLLQTLEQVMGPWPADLPRDRAERLVEALARVLERTRMAQRAREAPSPGFDWEDLLARVRRRVQEAPGPVELAALLAEEGRDRTDVIGLFLAVLELLRVGELWLTELEGNLCLRRRP